MESYDEAERRAGRIRCATLRLLLPVVVAALAIGHVAGLAAVARASPELHRTVATVLSADATARADGSAGPARATRADAVWTGADGRTHRGVLLLPGTPAVGSTRGIWVDGSGHPARPAVDGTGTALSVAAAVLALGGAGLVAARVSAARRASRLLGASLDLEWARYEPDWSGRRPDGPHG